MGRVPDPFYNRNKTILLEPFTGRISLSVSIIVQNIIVLISADL